MIIAVLVAAAIAAEYPAYPKPSYPSYPAYPSYKSYDYVSMLNIPWFLTINNKNSYLIAPDAIQLCLRR